MDHQLPRPGDAYRYPTEAMVKELLTAIADFRSVQESGLDYVHRRLRLPVPSSSREWMQYGYMVPSEVAAIAESDGVRVDIHGNGIEIIHPDFTIDYDYGPAGECDCFDAWRLALHRHRSHGLPMPVEGQLQFQAWLEAAEADGAIIALPNSPYFVHPAFRSGWTLAQTGG